MKSESFIIVFPNISHLYMYILYIHVPMYICLYLAYVCTYIHICAYYVLDVMSLSTCVDIHDHDDHICTFTEAY